MTTTYVGAGPWGAGQGAPLNKFQFDSNNYDKETRITALEALGLAVGVSSITVSGDQMTVHLTDSSIQGPFTLPSVAWTPRGYWQAGGLYSALDVVTYGGTAYLVSADHTAATSFDPNETTSTSVLLYQPIFSFEPAQGFERIGSTFTPALEDANTYNRMTNASGCAVTIDPAVGFPDWTEIHFRDESSETASFVSFSVATPGTINEVRGFLNQSLGPGATVTLKKVGSTDNWDIFGLLQPA